MLLISKGEKKISASHFLYVLSFCWNTIVYFPPLMTFFAFEQLINCSKGRLILHIVFDFQVIGMAINISFMFFGSLVIYQLQGCLHIIVMYSMRIWNIFSRKLLFLFLRSPYYSSSRNKFNILKYLKFNLYMIDLALVGDRCL